MTTLVSWEETDSDYVRTKTTNAVETTCTMFAGSTMYGRRGPGLQQNEPRKSDAPSRVVTQISCNMYMFAQTKATSESLIQKADSDDTNSGDNNSKNTNSDDISPASAPVGCTIDYGSTYKPADALDESQQVSGGHPRHAVCEPGVCRWRMWPLQPTALHIAVSTWYLNHLY